MARMSWIGLAAIALMLTGCISTDKYNALKMAYESQADQLAQASTKAEAAEREAAAYKRQVEGLANGDTNAVALIRNLTTQNAQLQTQLDDLNKRYADAIAKGNGGTVILNRDLSDALKAFAAQNPDLVEFDAARGMLKFKSDFTFASGSANLKPEAKVALDKLAGILNSAAASGYELMVAGHTDNDRVVHPETIAAGHKDNWYLSSHRAITVGEELMGQGVNPARMSVAGFADQHPVAPMSTPDGKARNRRVEVLILPSQATFSAVAPKTGGPAINKDQPLPRRTLNKDEPAAPVRPTINK